VRPQTEPVLGPGLLVELGRTGGGRLHEQLELSLRELIRSGRLAPGARLPSTRSLAAELGVSRGVVLEAYSQLTAEGYLTASQGAPTRVADAASAERPPVPAGLLEPRYRHDFDPFTPDVAAFPGDRWLKSLRTAVREAPYAELAHGDPRGASRLRDELTAYLGRARAAAPEPEHTLVCGGLTQGFAMVCRTLRSRGVERIAVEDPGFSGHRLTAEHCGLAVEPIPVDERGIDVSELRRSGCEVVVVTPAHQFPTGVVLASERRAALLEWAEEEDGLIVEDDYDSELRYGRDPVGALQGLSPERVCHLGSLSKRLLPGLRLGWILSPSWLTGALTYEQGIAHRGPAALEQLALADFVARGELDRHLRRVRLVYRERREALLGALARAIPGARVTGSAAGLYALALLPAGLDEEGVVSAAGARGVRVEGLASHRIRADAGAGLVLGFASVPAASMREGLRLIGEECKP
jgi:GntR family transcriptional regulator/MocR family aminotransferase